MCVLQTKKPTISSSWPSTTLFAWLALAGLPKTPLCGKLYPCRPQPLTRSFTISNLNVCTNIILLFKIYFMTLYGRLSILWSTRLLLTTQGGPSGLHCKFMFPFFLDKTDPSIENFSATRFYKKNNWVKTMAKGFRIMNIRKQLVLTTQVSAYIVLLLEESARGRVFLFWGSFTESQRRTWDPSKPWQYLLRRTKDLG